MAATVPAQAGSNGVDNQYFYEDEVFRIDKKGRVKFGLILETSDNYSSDEDDDFDDIILSKGEIRVAWYPEGKEEVHNERAVGLADRTLMPGDVVRRLVPGKDTQRGYCREIIMKADVRVAGTKYVVRNVVGDRLSPLLKMPRDNAVCLDSWVGSTKCVDQKVILMSSCGALIEVPETDLCQLKDVNSKCRIGIFAETVFYPGQTVTGRLESLDKVKLLTPSIVLKTNKKGKPIARKFVVESVEIEGVWVHWQCKALSEDGSDLVNGALQQPKSYVTGEELKRLKRLNLFESCMLQINDKNYLKICETDTIMRKSQWDKEQAITYKLIMSQMQKEESQMNKKFKIPTQTEKVKIKLTNTSLDYEKKYSKNLNHSMNSNSKMANNRNVEAINTKERIETDNCEGKKEDEIKSSNCLQVIKDVLDGTDGWQTDEELDDDDSHSESATTTISTCSSPTPRSSPKRSPLLRKKQAKKLRKSLVSYEKMPVIGEEVVTEALAVYSTATVVWQDGTIETNIPSTQLYPIHHLDDHEFFPGDFVLSNVERDASLRDYGVIQTVDHQGRTARVNWFTTYTSADEPRPAYTGESEVSVYDLKDHPDFQYRPGTIVIRVANFVGEDSTCTAGQVVDNYADGRVKVWWVDGHVSMCWPQDLFEVGQYDADHNWGNDSDNDSWETESEVSEPGGTPLKSVSEPYMSEHLERARVAMARLEEIFTINPDLQNRGVMRNLLAVYKKCRYLDRLMDTSFFHEDHFNGLLERVRKGGNQTKAELAQDQKNRLFNQSPSVVLNNSFSAHNNLGGTESITFAKDYSPRVALNVSSTPYKNYIKKRSSKTDIALTSKDTEINSISTQNAKDLRLNFDNEPKTSVLITNSISNTSANSPKPSGLENKLLSVVLSNIDKATQKTEDRTNKTENKKALKPNDLSSTSQDDSGNYSRIENCDGSSASYASSSDLTNDVNNSLLKVVDEQKSISSTTIELTNDSPEFVCARLCALLKGQLVKALKEIQQKFGQDNINLSEVVEYEITDTKTLEDAGIAIATCDEISQSNEEIIEERESPVSTPLIQPVPLECFQIHETAPSTHKFHLTIFHPACPQQYYKAVRLEHKLLRTSLPPGVWVRVFEDRMDLVSVMIEGPKNTPYEDGMFFFDIQLGREYPKYPPFCHYISYCSDRLNPNLYEDGKVCVSLLGTWSGRDSEVWGPNSTLLQVIVSIQGLILVSEPYFNEAGYEKQKGTQQGKENSRMYNEMVILKLVQSMTKLISSPPEIFRDQIYAHFKNRGEGLYQRIKGWMEISQIADGNEENKVKPNVDPPEFPLVPASRGFCLTLAGLLETFHHKLETINDQHLQQTHESS